MTAAKAHDEKPTVGFFDRGNASYIQSDLDLLRSNCLISRSSFVARKPWSLPLAWFKQFVECIRIIPSSTVVFVHFAGWNSVIPLILSRLFNKRSVLFLHGTDSVHLPTIGYGNFGKWPLALATCHSVHSARTIVAVDGSLIASENQYVQGQQGVMHFCKDLKTPSQVIPHGFDPERWPLGTGHRDIDVLTVGLELHQNWRRQLKGVDLLLDVARRMPRRRFMIICTGAHAIPDLPGNVTALGQVSLSQLVQWYQRAVVYAQMSMSEGFGCALAEAMLCGCIPVVSAVGAMPRIIGATGVVVRKRDAIELEHAIGSMLARKSINASHMAREQITKNYSLRIRSEALSRLVNST